jgi:hypothetical protein
VVAIQPTTRFMDRSGMGTSTRDVAIKLWDGRIPDRDPAKLIRELYWAENEGQAAPSGSQDMAGILYPGVSRLDYDYEYEGGYFPIHVESNIDPAVASWLNKVIHMVPIAQRPLGYDPLEIKNLDPEWISRLGQTGKECFDAIVARDAVALGNSMNDCMTCWEAILPGTVRHSTISIDLVGILKSYQERYIGAMYSGCGGGYIYVVSEEPVPNSINVEVKISNDG